VAGTALGPGRFVAQAYSTDIYFEPGAYEKLAAQPAAMAAVLTAIDEQPGVARVFRREELTTGRTSSDPALRAAALSYVPRLSGDLVVLPEAGWMFTSSGTTHGSSNAYDQRVPFIMMGPGVRPGHYGEEVTPADLAPTLAALTGVSLRRADGRVLGAALLPR
jgi:arylsulfatase A-like enzyme